MTLVPRPFRAGLALATLSTLAAGQQQATTNAVLMDDLVQGDRAIERLTPQLAALAEKSEMSVAEFADMVRVDDSIHVDGNGNLLFIDPFFVDGDPGEGEETDDDGTQYRGGSSDGNIPLSQAFNLHSRPGSNFTIYIDFDGHHSVNNAWGHNIVFPPFNRSGPAGVFSNAELQEIIDHWRHMAEDFAPFDVNVTTEEPPIDDLRRTGGGDTRWGIRDVHTQATSGFGDGIGGVAFLNSFTWRTDTPCFSFNKGSISGSATGSHEVGHALGLSHDGLGSSEYHPGTSVQGWTWGPIMGAPFGAEVIQWSNGDYPNSTRTQNDTNIISSSSNGTTLIPDDHGNAILGGTIVSPNDCPTPGQIQVCGLITFRDDKDAFTFWSDGGAFSVDGYPTDQTVSVGNMDVKLELFDPSGVKLVGSNPSRDKTSRIARTLSPGWHTILVDGGPQGNQYSDYGSRGHYTLDISLETPSHFTDLGNGLAGSLGEPVLEGFGDACEGQIVGVELSNAAPNAPTFLAYGAFRADLPLRGGVLVPDIGPGGAYLSLSTNGAGGAIVSDIWPGGLSSGFEMHFQYWVLDPSGPQNFTASNAAVITVP